MADAIVSLGSSSATTARPALPGSEAPRQRVRLGKHAYRLSRDGIHFFPRLADHDDGDTYDFARERISSGVPILDDMLADGYWRGASTLVAGPSGAGKTLVALHFVFSGADLGEQGIFATFQENPIQLERVVEGFSWTFEEPKVELMFRPPVDLYLDEWVYDLLDLIERTGAQRVAIDSLGDLPSGVRRRDPIPRVHVLAPAALCATQCQRDYDSGGSELFGITRLSEFGISHVSDNVVLLAVPPGATQSKARDHCPQDCAAACTIHASANSTSPSKGLSLGDQFLPDQSLL